MTSNITPIGSASSNGADVSTAGERKPREHGMTVVRESEAKALISLGMDALGEACHMGHQLHSAIYDKEASKSNTELQDTLAEALTCVERAEHYLLLLGSNFEENTPSADADDAEGDPWAVP
jgi:hypothetical protein